MHNHFQCMQFARCVFISECLFSFKRINLLRLYLFAVYLSRSNHCYLWLNLTILLNFNKTKNIGRTFRKFYFYIQHLIDMIHRIYDGYLLISWTFDANWPFVYLLCFLMQKAIVECKKSYEKPQLFIQFITSNLHWLCAHFF